VFGNYVYIIFQRSPSIKHVVLVTVIFHLQMNPLDLLRLLRKGRLRNLDNLQQLRPYRIMYIDRIIYGAICFMVYTRENPINIHSDEYLMFYADSTFTTQAEFEINQNRRIA